VLIWAAAIAVLALMGRFWRPLMMTALQPDVAAVEGVRAARMRMLLMLLVALAVAVGIKVAGMLLITSLLIIPAAAARGFARNPLHMVLLAAGTGVVAVAAGLWGAFALDTPSGPAIILAALGVFGVSGACRSVIASRGRSNPGI
jgi:zinc transport system permease protein